MNPAQGYVLCIWSHVADRLHMGSMATYARNALNFLPRSQFNRRFSVRHHAAIVASRLRIPLPVEYPFVVLAQAMG
jgi:hypothetical protein